MYLHRYDIRGQSLLLCADRSLFWEEEQTLIVSDLHFGKTGHFRKSGIPAPQSVSREDLQRLIAQLQFFKPRRLIVVGDMFHSVANKELDMFMRWRNDFSRLPVHLVKGNHDILPGEWYKTAGIEIAEEMLQIAGFRFRHDPVDGAITDNGDEAPYTFSGHIHPGITINGLGKQSLRFPCFYFTERYCILPAFSRFTGTVSVLPDKKDATFAIVGQTLVKIR
ncbi:MAG TPA: ligase-associated DNA damage response endonuclease PdeM [Flavitalea sp.]|nr:ligase-associated DNA damage response endonuclease PdeM [Flavitalea sp.]